MRRTLVLVVICLLFLLGCEDKPWYGKGVVTEKIYSDALSCYLLKLTDENGKQRERCVSEKVWYDAMLDHQINITKEYS